MRISGGWVPAGVERQLGYVGKKKNKKEMCTCPLFPNFNADCNRLGNYLRAPINIRWQLKCLINVRWHLWMWVTRCTMIETLLLAGSSNNTQLSCLSGFFFLVTFCEHDITTVNRACALVCGIKEGRIRGSGGAGGQVSLRWKGEYSDFFEGT